MVGKPTTLHGRRHETVKLEELDYTYPPQKKQHVGL